MIDFLISVELYNHSHLASRHGVTIYILKFGGESSIPLTIKKTNYQKKREANHVKV